MVITYSIYTWLQIWGILLIELYNNNHLSINIGNGLGKFRYTVNTFLPYSVLLYLKEHLAMYMCLVSLYTPIS